MLMKNPKTPSGINPVTFLFVAQCKRNEYREYFLGVKAAGA
jgi:hypothetical protein